ncbi:PhoX family phosphatase [Nocardioides sp. JQ2195]|uniref:PhoX family protein n=1 Tax=Nocardioides sp. JQ2195 TaxID=2592334 RepID=UPI00143E169D|nr:PhoX family phosphatase [Nocardioides sp. JQ2195]QIX25377.1 PhoX family phosphatase [Nocardioides sp. JQ2195]
MTTRKLLPFVDRAHPGGRSSMTCLYRCGNACAHPVPNESANEHFEEVVARAVSRRSVLRAGAVGAAAAGVLGATGWGAVSPAAASGTARATAPAGGPLSRFSGIAPTAATTDELVVPSGFTWSPLIAWGDPITRDAPAFDFDNQSVEAQRCQAGYNCDFTALLLDGRGRGARSGVLAFNNEYTNDELMFRGVGSSADLSDDQLRIVMAAHGMTIVEVRRERPGTPWRYLQAGRRNRRLHSETPFVVDGPAAGHAALRTSADPTGKHVLGTLNNCAGGVTPWGTVLSGEENFNQYFNTTGASDPDGRLKRYGITSGGRGWERVDPRFDVATEPNEVNRFGWIVEVDPDDPGSRPVKHTALGRFKHEGATIRLADDGRAVAYMGDDERNDYIYKFVSRKKHRPGNRRHNAKLLSEGDLHVAKFTGDGAGDGQHDGTGEWLPLVVDGRSQVPGWSVEEVLIWTRQAADLVGPTKMDRPEDVEANPVTWKVYAALTNNTARQPGQVDEANPRGPNKHGHVIEISEHRNDAAAVTFTWQIVLVAGDPTDPSTYFAGFDRDQVSPISCPDNVTFDRTGNLWISTDGMPGTLGFADGLYMLPLEGRERGRLKQFLSVPVGAECSGPVISADDRTVLVAVQHPGEVSGASPEHVVSTFPYLGDGQPRPAIAQVWRD